MDYNYQKPVSEYKAFLGRRALVSKIYARIGAGRPQSVSIVGDLKVGKSSLLWYLAHEETKKTMLSKPEEYIYLFIPCRADEQLTLESFTRIVYDISRKYTDPDGERDKSPYLYNYFKNLVESLHKQNKKIILFLDDFNLVTQNTAFPLEFFSFLRSLANNYNLAYITTSYEDLQKLCVSKDIEESPFFNIFTNMSLRGFDPDEIDTLFKPSDSNNGKDIRSEQEYLVHLVGTIPFPLQMACHYLLTIKNDHQPLDNEQRKQIESLLAEKLYAYHQQLWSGMEENHRHILTNLASGLRILGAQGYLVRDLEKKNYIDSSNGKNTIASMLFQNFICDINHSTNTVREKSSNLWQPLLWLKKIISGLNVRKQL